MSALGPHPVTLRQLQYLVAVADAGSFRAAARSCGVSQPSLSAQIALAEDALGIQVFERTSRRCAATPEGTRVVARARAILLAMDDLVASARPPSDPTHGLLQLGILPTVAPYLLPHLAPALRAAFPRLTIAWSEEKTATMLSRLAAGTLDGGVLALEDEVAELPHLVLGKDPFVLAVANSHPLARGRGPVRAEQLHDEPVLLLDEGHCFRAQALAFCTRSGATEAGFRGTSLATLAQLAASGMGITLLPALAVPVEAKNAGLHVRPIAPHGPARTLVLAWRRGSLREPSLRLLVGPMQERVARRVFVEELVR